MGACITRISDVLHRFSARAPLAEVATVALGDGLFTLRAMDLAPVAPENWVYCRINSETLMLSLVRLCLKGNICKEGHTLRLETLEHASGNYFYSAHADMDERIGFPHFRLGRMVEVPICQVADTSTHAGRVVAASLPIVNRETNAFIRSTGRSVWPFELLPLTRK